jgi:predicted nuclease of restriction endonuclease-like (RecB) superfamily
MLAIRLSEEFGRGFSKRNLDYMRRFYLDYAGRLPRIVQKPSAQFAPAAVLQAPTEQLAISEKPVRKSRNPFTLSWSHYVLLLTIRDPDERSSYEIEASNEGWSVPELKRQKSSALYERLALSRDKDGVKRLAAKGQVVTRPEDVLKEPYVLEFLGLDEKAGYSETELEAGPITHLEHFLLELGKGFLYQPLAEAARGLVLGAVGLR